MSDEQREMVRKVVAELIASEARLIECVMQRRAGLWVDFIISEIQKKGQA